MSYYSTDNTLHSNICYVVYACSWAYAVNDKARIKASENVWAAIQIRVNKPSTVIPYLCLTMRRIGGKKSKWL